MKKSYPFEDVMETQRKLNELICGEHIWSPMSGYLIVGFTLFEKIWNGTPTRSGWDTIKETRVIDTYARCEDAISEEEKLRKRNFRQISYDIRPIQVRMPLTRKPANLSAAA